MTAGVRQEVGVFAIIGGFTDMVGLKKSDALRSPRPISLQRSGVTRVSIVESRHFGHRMIAWLVPAPVRGLAVASELRYISFAPNEDKLSRICPM